MIAQAANTQIEAFLWFFYSFSVFLYL